MTARRPLAAAISCSRVVDGMRVQSVSERFLTPLDRISDLATIVVPSMERTSDARALATVLDVLILTGSVSNVAPKRYGSDGPAVEPVDHGRDATALALAAAMIEAGRTVFGICRGHQELNVLYGGTLHADLGEAGLDGPAHHPETGGYGDALASNLHPVQVRDGVLGPARTIDVVSAHHQGVDRLGRGLRVEASAPDGLVEAVSDFGRAAVLGVQWHPEWNVGSCASSREFFETLGRAARGDRTGCALARAA